MDLLIESTAAPGLCLKISISILSSWPPTSPEEILGDQRDLKERLPRNSKTLLGNVGSKWHPPLENQCLGALHPFPALLCFCRCVSPLGSMQAPPGRSWLGESWGGIQGAKASPTAALGPPKVLLFPLAAVPFPSIHHWPSLGSCQKLQPGTPCLARGAKPRKEALGPGTEEAPTPLFTPHLIHPSFPTLGKVLGKAGPASGPAPCGDPTLSSLPLFA